MKLGFTISGGGSTYWVGEAMGSKEYKHFKTSAESRRCVDEDERAK